jgi:polyhydroxybutyrate depolymerase
MVQNRTVKLRFGFLAPLGLTFTSLIVGCSTGPSQTTQSMSPETVIGSEAPARSCKNTEFGGERPATLGVPTTYDCQRAAPLVVALHGYTGNGGGTVEYFGLKAEAEKRGFLYLAPNGTADGAGNNFWNATNACCDFAKTNVDDSTYLSTLVADVAAEWNVDPKRVYFIGHSNGGFMSYRMACEHSEQIAAIASLAGAMRDDAEACAPAQAVSVLQIHGSSDTTISYQGGQIGANPYPSAQQSVSDWQSLNECATEAVTSTGAYDLDELIAGADTDTITYSGCRDATAVALWTIPDGPHSPQLSAGFASAVLDFFQAHPKP